MPRSYIGVDIGRHNLRLAYREHGLRFETHRLPENIVAEEGIRSPQVMADFLRSVRGELGIGARRCALVLSDELAIFQHVTMPPMSVEELTLNLPYEFRDYISDDPEAYSYDYAVDRIVKDDAGKPTSTELYTAAARKDLMDSLVNIFKRAGMGLQLVIPSPLAYMNLLASDKLKQPVGAVGNIVVADVRFDRINISLYEGGRFLTTRVVYAGCEDIDQAIVDLTGVDSHIAQSYRQSNFENVLETLEVEAVYDRLIFELSKVINFYSFSNPDREISAVYLAGEGAELVQLVERVAQSIDYPVWLVNSLMGDEAAHTINASTCALAYASMLAIEGR